MKRIMNKIKEKGAVICAFLLCITSIATMAGCGKLPSSFVTSDKIKVVCTTFPQYDWVRQILGENSDEFEIKLLTDNGVDMHSYQPSTADIAAVASCDVLVYTGGTSENWVASALKEAVNPDMTVVNLMDYLGDSIKEEELVEGMQGDSHGHTHSHEQTKAVLNRLSRAIGHLESIKRMVEDGRDCSEVLIQLSAVKSAINNTGKIILQDHIEHCIVDAVEHGDRNAIKELEKAIDRFMK